jgi:hypothetical protein
MGARSAALKTEVVKIAAMKHLINVILVYSLFNLTFYCVAQTNDTITRTYMADDPEIVYTGRIDFSDPLRPRFSSPGVYIQARFAGTSCTVNLQDQFVVSPLLGAQRNFYEVIIDGRLEFKLEPVSGTTAYPVVRNLPFGLHRVMLVKRSQSLTGYGEFLGFTFSGQIRPPDPAPAHKLEFIGNSISCGSGSEAENGSVECTQNCYYTVTGRGLGQPYYNAYKAFGPVVARMVNAEYHLTSVSGIGLVRNGHSLSILDNRNMQQVYDLEFMEIKANPPVWDVSAYVPDAVVIELGTNDFLIDDTLKTAMDSATFTGNYIKFIDTLKSYYPKANFFCISSPMMGSTSPSTVVLKNSLAAVESHYKSKGDYTVHKFIVTPIEGHGCGGHPDTTEQRKIASELAPFIKTTMGWNDASPPAGNEICSGIIVFPNPVADFLTIDLNENIEIEARVILTDYQGQIIRSQDFNNESILKVDVSGMTNGLYFYSIRSSLGNCNGKFIKMNHHR